MILRYYRRALAVGAVFVFFGNLAVYLSLPHVASLNPWYWIGAFALAAAPLYLSRESFAVFRRSAVTGWCYCYAMVSAIWLLFEAAASEFVWQEFRLRIASVFLLLTLLAVFSTEDARLWARRAVMLVTLAAVAINLYELFNPLTFSLAPGRSAGLYFVSTQSGAALVAGMILGLGALGARYRLLFTLAAGLGILLTFARGPMLCWLIAALMLAKMGEINLKRSFVIGCGVAAIALALLMPYWDGLLYELKGLGVLNRDVVGRLEGFTRAGEFGIDESAAKRKEAMSVAWDLIGASPVVGHGVGASKEWNYEMGTHNQYLALMVDHGALGFLFLPLLVLATIWRARGESRRVGITFALYALILGWFSHHMLEDHFLLVTFALLAAMVAASRADEREQVAAKPMPPLQVEARRVEA